MAGLRRPLLASGDSAALAAIIYRRILSFDWSDGGTNGTITTFAIVVGADMPQVCARYDLALCVTATRLVLFVIGAAKSK
jgi:hypothetical protein